ncbi:XcbB/CpsF family capsular polysaccharide biosynthesis protein [Lacticaseibacillus sharpeae]|uniref:XcbB/CpsF family capsular polysaccharide biosynthesis protein n=2 Tax=Lacticaseibacillus sharpeae TaxID=1626 RepID=UPI000704CE81|nr:XcbB/CpsF family capsular polysaccharide biosynthesis protein [Lacticaseibacillus sharpeae]
MKRTVIRLGEQPDWSSEKIVINTGTSDNILKLSRTDASANKAYREMLAHDYVLYMHSNEKSFFIKRTLVSTLWERKDLIQFGDTFYTLMDVPENKVNRLAPKRLVVIFSSMPSAKDYLSDKIAPRMFVQNYPSLWKQVVKNTMILRIMDLNLSYGSYYMNAGSYNTFEDDVQGIIAKVCEGRFYNQVSHS